MYKIDPKVKKQLQDIADALPKVLISPATKVMTGKQLVDASGGKTMTDREGKALDPDKKYKLEFKEGVHEHNVNHFKKLKQAYEKGGNAGVEQYVDKIIKPKKDDTK